MNEPKHTCPEIDKGLEHAKQIESSLTYILKQDDVKWHVENIEYYLGYLVDTLEYCRNQCEDLRSWGQHWKEQAEELENELDS